MILIKKKKKINHQLVNEKSNGKLSHLLISYIHSKV